MQISDSNPLHPSRHYTPGNSVNADANNKSPYKAQKRGVFSSMKPHKTRLRFQQYFSSTKATWSEQFGIDTNGDFVVKFNRSEYVICWKLNLLIELMRIYIQQQFD